MNVFDFLEIVKRKKWFEVDSTNEKMVERLVKEGKVEYLGERTIAWGAGRAVRKKIRTARVKR